MYYYYTDDQNSCKKPAIAQSIQTPMKATIICLPPILHTCQNVPAADRASCGSATAVIIKKQTRNIKGKTNNNNKNNNNNNNDHINNSCSVYSDTVASTTIRGGSCCHHWEHKNYDYEKHKPKTTTTTATRTTTATSTEGATRMVTIATPTTRQHNQQKGQEENIKRQNNAGKNNKNNNTNSYNRTHQQHATCLRNGNTTSTTNFNIAAIRERRRHFYNLKENITSLTLSSACQSSSSSLSSSTALTSTSNSTSLSPLPTSSWRCRTMVKIAESTTMEAIANRTSKLEATSTSRPSSSLSLSTSSSFWPQCDLQINCKQQKMSNAVCCDDKRAVVAAPAASTNDHKLWQLYSNENVCLVDSFTTLRSKQLVWPIETESRQRHRQRHCNSYEQTTTTTKKLMCSQQLLERQTLAVNSYYNYYWLQAMEVARSAHLKENRRTTTAASLTTYTSASTSANVSQTTKKLNAFTFPDECELLMLSSRATNCPQTQTKPRTRIATTTTIAGDIITHDEVKNFRWSDDDDNNNGNSDAVGDRNCSTIEDFITYRLERKESQQWQKQQHPVKLPKTTKMYQHQPPAQSKSLLKKSYYNDSNVQRQQLLWQMPLLVWVFALLQEQRHQVVKMSTTSSASKLLLSTLMMLMLITTANCWAGRADVPTNCTFPLRWEGSWFLSGYQQSIHIKGSQISYRGRCAASDGNKYLIVDEKGCHRCLVIYEKHENVLQYKESECEGDSMYMHQSNPSAMAMRSVLKQNGGDHRGGAHPNTNTGHSRLSSSDQYIMRSNDDMNDYFCKGRETLQNLCDQIPGDALLYSLFRENAEPVKCPLKGPFIFTYNRGHGECKSPVSNIESCTEDSRLLLSFQACPDVQGTESTVEELTCLAAWKDGNSRYLVGLVSHHHAISNEERYRCFVYEKYSSLMGGPSMVSSKDAEYKLAQSGDATCNGLDSAEVGSRIMTLRKPPVAERCDFPVWFKGPRHWHALMGNAVYNYHTNDGSVHIIKSNGYMETRALCEQINKQTATEMMAVVHYTTGCQSGFMCMLFYRRDTHVIEIQTGKQASRLEDACAPDHFDVHKMPYITLLASNPDPQICPMEGLYNLRGAIGPPYLTTRHKRNHNNKAHSSHGHHHLSDGFSSSSSSSGSGSGGSSANIGSNIESSDIYGRKRRGSLSFRNSDRIEKLSWHANTRGLPIRSRRDAIVLKPKSKSKSANLTAAAGGFEQTNDITSNMDGSKKTMTTSTKLSKRAKHTQFDESPSPVKSPTAVKQAAVAAAPSASVTLTTPTMMKTALNTTTMATTRQSMTATTTATIASTDLAIIRQRNRRDVPGCITNFKAQRQLWMGCTEPNVIDVRPLCNDEGDEEYYCHGSWTENTTVYIIARHKRTKHGVCISYRPTESTSAKLVIGDACYRGTDKPPEHHLVANLSVFGKCGETGSASSTKINIFSYSITLAVSIFATFYSGSWNKLSLSIAALGFQNSR